MKKILFIIIAFSLAVSSCIFKDEPADPVVGVFDTPVLEDVSGSYVFEEEQADQVFKTFSWSEADFGFQAAVIYTIQIDFSGNERAAYCNRKSTGNQR